MKLYIIDSILLEDLAALKNGPKPGDAVAYWRHAQDAEGLATRRLKEHQIEVEWAEGRINEGDIDRIDTFVERVGSQWYLKNGKDTTLWLGFSFGSQLTKDLIGRGKFNILVRYG
ncbi:MAG: hypothetical protein VW802_01595, partial [Rhodospirillaceae bacterium]